MSPTSIGRLVYSVAEVAADLGIHRRTVSRMIARGQLEARRTGSVRGRLLITRESLERWLSGAGSRRLTLRT
jgi:excisionase family DNA binding protein